VSIVGSYRQIQSALDRRIIRLEETRRDQGETSVVVAVMWEDGKTVNERYYFNPDKGYLPTQIERFDSTGDMTISVALVETAPYPGGRWFPTKAAIWYPKSSGGVGRNLLTVETSDLDVDTPPPPSALFVDVPGGVPINCSYVRGASFGFAKPTTVHASELTTVLTTALAQATVQEIRASQERRRPMVFFTVTSVSVFILVFGRHILVHRRRRFQSGS
jgi:hypothetical protein